MGMKLYLCTVLVQYRNVLLLIIAKENKPYFGRESQEFSRNHLDCSAVVFTFSPQTDRSIIISRDIRPYCKLITPVLNTTKERDVIICSNNSILLLILPTCLTLISLPQQTNKIVCGLDGGRIHSAELLTGVSVSVSVSVEQSRAEQSRSEQSRAEQSRVDLVN